MLVATLDVNIIISAILTDRGVIREIFYAWKDGEYGLLLSLEMIREVTTKLSQPRLADAYAISRNDVQAVRELLVHEALLIDVPPGARRRVTGDPEDDHVLAAAHSGSASYLVTGDKELLALKRYGGTHIVKARAFADLLRQRRQEGAGACGVMYQEPSTIEKGRADWRDLRAPTRGPDAAETAAVAVPTHLVE